LIDSDAMEDQVAFSPDGETTYIVSTRMTTQISIYCRFYRK
jgi:hypothetical protein